MGRDEEERQIDAIREPLLQENDRLRKRCSELEELLRSAICIAHRRGDGTAWNRFIASGHRLGLNGVTARTYRRLPDDGDDA